MSINRSTDLALRFPPSPPCACETCLAFCTRPGWWTVDEAARAIDAGYAQRMMLEMSPDLSFGVLSPAFKENEGDFARQRHASNGCTFLAPDLYCELHGTGLQPLECRFCHHSRKSRGPACHAAIENDWRSPVARSLVVGWTKMIGLWEKKVVWRRF